MNEVAAVLHSAAVFDQVALEIARRWIAPVGEGPHRHALPDRRARTPAAPADTSGCFAFRAQQAVDGGSADLQKPASYHRVELEMPVTFHRLDQHRDQNLEAACRRCDRPPPTAVVSA